MNKKVFISLQGKGGCSKSTTLGWLYSFLKSSGKAVKGFDTDPNNATLAGFQSLDVTVVKIMDDHQNIDSRKFDDLVEGITNADAEFVLVDVGATNFNSLMAYWHDSGMEEYFEDLDIKVCCSVPIVGGPMHAECIKGLHFLFKNTNMPQLIWMNQYFGPMPTGKDAPEPIIRKALADRLVGIIHIPNRDSETFGQDIHELQTAHLTFEDYLEAPANSIMAHRIRKFRRELYSELENIFSQELAYEQSKN